MGIYEGIRTNAGCRVTYNDRPLRQRQDVRNHSPTGFEWGYGGSGPAQLALAILCNETDTATALIHYQEFKWKVISKIKSDKLMIPSEYVQEWLDTTRQKERDQSPWLLRIEGEFGLFDVRRVTDRELEEYLDDYVDHDLIKEEIKNSPDPVSVCQEPWVLVKYEPVEEKNG